MSSRHATRAVKTKHGMIEHAYDHDEIDDEEHLEKGFKSASAPIPHKHLANKAEMTLLEPLREGVEDGDEEEEYLGSQQHSELNSMSTLGPSISQLGPQSSSASNLGGSGRVRHTPRGATPNLASTNENSPQLVSPPKMQREHSYTKRPNGGGGATVGGEGKLSSSGSSAASGASGRLPPSSAPPASPHVAQQQRGGSGRQNSSLVATSSSSSVSVSGGSSSKKKKKKSGSSASTVGSNVGDKNGQNAGGNNAKNGNNSNRNSNNQQGNNGGVNGGNNNRNSGNQNNQSNRGSLATGTIPLGMNPGMGVGMGGPLGGMGSMGSGGSMGVGMGSWDGSGGMWGGGMNGSPMNPILPPFMGGNMMGGGMMGMDPNFPMFGTDLMDMSNTPMGMTNTQMSTPIGTFPQGLTPSPMSMQNNTPYGGFGGVNLSGTPGMSPMGAPGGFNLGGTLNNNTGNNNTGNNTGNNNTGNSSILGGGKGSVSNNTNNIGTLNTGGTPLGTASGSNNTGFGGAPASNVTGNTPLGTLQGSGTPGTGYLGPQAFVPMGNSGAQLALDADGNVSIALEGVGSVFDGVLDVEGSIETPNSETQNINPQINPTPQTNTGKQISASTRSAHGQGTTSRQGSRVGSTVGSTVGSGVGNNAKNGNGNNRASFNRKSSSQLAKGGSAVNGNQNNGKNQKGKGPQLTGPSWADLSEQPDMSSPESFPFDLPTGNVGNVGSSGGVGGNAGGNAATRNLSNNLGPLNSAPSSGVGSGVGGGVGGMNTGMNTGMYGGMYDGNMYGSMYGDGMYGGMGGMSGSYTDGFYPYGSGGGMGAGMGAAAPGFGNPAGWEGDKGKGKKGLKGKKDGGMKGKDKNTYQSDSWRNEGSWRGPATGQQQQVMMGQYGGKTGPNAGVQRGSEQWADPRFPGAQGNMVQARGMFPGPGSAAHKPMQGTTSTFSLTVKDLGDLRKSMDKPGLGRGWSTLSATMSSSQSAVGTDVSGSGVNGGNDTVTPRSGVNGNKTSPKTNDGKDVNETPSTKKKHARWETRRKRHNRASQGTQWHIEASTMGRVTSEHIPTTNETQYTFTKDERFDGRLSTISENSVRVGGVHRYCIKFHEDVRDALSVADGMGFVFSDHLPCTKNIQRIQSIFLNRKGQICCRHGAQLTKANIDTAKHPIELGKYMYLEADLENKVLSVWGGRSRLEDETGPAPDNASALSFAEWFPNLQQSTGPVKGYLTSVIKYSGAGATLCGYWRMDLDGEGLSGVPAGHNGALSSTEEQQGQYHQSKGGNQSIGHVGMGNVGMGGNQPIGNVGNREAAPSIDDHLFQEANDGGQ